MFSWNSTITCLIGVLVVWASAGRAPAQASKASAAMPWASRAAGRGFVIPGTPRWMGDIGPRVLAEAGDKVMNGADLTPPGRAQICRIPRNNFGRGEARLTFRRVSRPALQQIALPGFADEILAEGMMRLPGDQLEARLLIDMARRMEHVVGPERHAPVAGMPGEAQAFLHQP